MSPKLHWSKTTLLFSGLAVWGLLLVSCISVDRTVVVPPHIPGAKYVGQLNIPPSTSVCSVDGSCTAFWQPHSVADYNLLTPKIVEFKAADGTTTLQGDFCSCCQVAP